MLIIKVRETASKIMAGILPFDLKTIPISCMYRPEYLVKGQLLKLCKVMYKVICSISASVSVLIHILHGHLFSCI